MTEGRLQLEMLEGRLLMDAGPFDNPFYSGMHIGAYGKDGYYEFSLSGPGQGTWEIDSNGKLCIELLNTGYGSKFAVKGHADISEFEAGVIGAIDAKQADIEGEFDAGSLKKMTVNDISQGSEMNVGPEPVASKYRLNLTANRVQGVVDIKMPVGTASIYSFDGGSVDIDGSASSFIVKNNFIGGYSCNGQTGNFVVYGRVENADIKSESFKNFSSKWGIYGSDISSGQIISLKTGDVSMATIDSAILNAAFGNISKSAIGLGHAAVKSKFKANNLLGTELGPFCQYSVDTVDNSRIFADAGCKSLAVKGEFENGSGFYQLFKPDLGCGIHGKGVYLDGMQAKPLAVSISGIMADSEILTKVIGTTRLKSVGINNGGDVFGIFCGNSSDAIAGKKIRVGNAPYVSQMVDFVVRHPMIDHIPKPPPFT